MKMKPEFTLETAIKELFRDTFSSNEEAFKFIEKRTENHGYMISGIIKHLDSIISGYQQEVYKKEKRVVDAKEGENSTSALVVSE